jgi:hypothetical protein
MPLNLGLQMMSLFTRAICSIFFYPAGAVNHGYKNGAKQQP